MGGSAESARSTGGSYAPWGQSRSAPSAMGRPARLPAYSNRPAQPQQLPTNAPLQSPGEGNPQGLAGNVNWEDMLNRLRSEYVPERSGGTPQTQWRGGLARGRDQFTQGRGEEAITNPGSLAASQGAQTPSGITAPGSGTGAPAAPTGANPHAPTSGQMAGPQGRGNNSHVQQLIQALRQRGGGQ